jgi:hypothetical protein
MGIAFLWYCDTHRCSTAKGLRWARAHWMEFLDERDSDTGKLLLEMWRRDSDNRRDAR